MPQDAVACFPGRPLHPASQQDGGSDPLSQDNLLPSKPSASPLHMSASASTSPSASVLFYIYSQAAYNRSFLTRESAEWCPAFLSSATAAAAAVPPQFCYVKHIDDTLSSRRTTCDGQAFSPQLPLPCAALLQPQYHHEKQPSARLCPLACMSRYEVCVLQRSVQGIADTRMQDSSGICRGLY